MFSDATERNNQRLKPEAALRKDRTNAASSMEHRHFAIVAAIIKTLDIPFAEQVRVQAHFANELAKTNPRFDRARFLRACNV